MLAGISVENQTGIEPRKGPGRSEDVLEGEARRALWFDGTERGDHCGMVRGSRSTRSAGRRPSRQRRDIVATHSLDHALYPSGFPVDHVRR
jgi:hypothetical protein